MKQLDINDLNLCKIQAEIFEKSLEISHFSSPMFIRRFMMNEEMTNAFDNKSYLILSNSKEDLLYELNDKYKASNKMPQYSKDAMYWIGYMYRALCILYDFSSKQVYRMFPGPEIVEYYPIYHTFGVEQAAERILETIDLVQRDLTEEGVKLMKRLMNLEELSKLIGKEVRVTVDDSYETIYPKKENGIDYVYYGRIDLKDTDGKFLGTYIVGFDKITDICNGKVIAIMYRSDSDENKLVVAPENKEYTTKEINSLLKSQEKNYKYKIIK